MMSIAQNALNSRPVRLLRCMNKLADMINNIGDIWPGNSEMLKSTNDTAILSGIIIREQHTIKCGKTIRGRHRCRGSLALEHTSTAKQIKRVFVLSENQAIIRMSDLQTKEIMQLAQVLDSKSKTQRSKETISGRI
jgi:hypothetical protein